MHTNELITTVRRNLGEPEIATVKDAILALHGHGVADDTTGNVEAPCGHVIRVDRWIVRTDSQGFTDLEEYGNVETARKWFAEYEDDYADWERD